MTAYLDTNVLLAILNPAEAHHGWCVKRLEQCKATGPALISDIVYSELSAGMVSKEKVDKVVSNLGLERIKATDEALFTAGQIYRKYKAASGSKTNVLPDFIIGAEAVDTGVPLITTNAKDFVSKFPGIKIVAP